MINASPLEPADLLMEYGEWLDSQGLLVGDSAVESEWRRLQTIKKPGEDQRTHEELVEDFLAERRAGRSARGEAA